MWIIESVGSVYYVRKFWLQSAWFQVDWNTTKRPVILTWLANPVIILPESEKNWKNKNVQFLNKQQYQAILC